MNWKSIESVLKNEWVLVKSLIEKNIGTEEFVQESNEFNYFIFVARLSDYGWWNVNTNTCGCCNRDLKPYEWCEIPK